MTPIFWRKFMKWKLLLALSFCFSLLIPITTNAFQDVDGKYTGGTTTKPSIPTTKPISPNTAKNISKATKVVKIGAAVKTANHIRRNKWKYAAGAVIVGATAASYYRNDIDRIIDDKFYSNKWRSEKKSELVPVLYKKIHNAKPEKQEAIIEAIQQSLKYYMVMYHNEPFGKLATDIATSLSLMDGTLTKEVELSISSKEKASFIIDSVVLNLKRKNRKTNCRKGSIEREFIKNKYSYTTNEIVLKEWDVDAYGYQDKINTNYNNSVNKVRSKYYNFHKDHIPSKRAIELFLQNRDNGNKPLSSDIVSNIEANATSVVLIDKIHRAGRTYGWKNPIASVVDSKDLFVAMVLDFETYYVMFAERGLVDDSFIANWSRAFAETYILNEKLCLFERSKL